MKGIMKLDRGIRDVIIMDEDGDAISSIIESRSLKPDLGHTLFEISLIMKMARGMEENFGELHNLRITHEDISYVVFPLHERCILFVLYMTREFDHEILHTIARYLHELPNRHQTINP